MPAASDRQRMHHRPFAALALLSLFLGLLSGSAYAQTTHRTPPQPKRGGVATFAVSDFTTLDPGSPAFTAGVQIQMGYPIYDGLFLPTKNGVKPWIATGYKYSIDFRTLDIYLRPDVRFQDGTPFNSAAVAYNFHRYETAPSGVTSYFSEATTLDTPNPTTVVVHFSQPDANFISAIASTQAGFIGSPTAIQSEGTAFGQKPVGAGPFKVTQVQPGTSATYTAWPGYWDAKHRYLSGLKAIVVGAGDAVEYQDLQAGDLSFFYDTSQGIPSVIHSAQRNRSLTVKMGPDQTINSLGINIHRPPFNNQLARGSTRLLPES